MTLLFTLRRQREREREGREREGEREGVGERGGERGRDRDPIPGYGGVYKSRWLVTHGEDEMEDGF